MSFRLERIGHVVRDVVSDAIASKISDPRVSRFTSVTRVEMSGDLRHANVYVSVMGSDADAVTTLRGLESARGMIHSRLAKSLDIRQCPMVCFHLDHGLKIAARTIQQINEAIADTAPAEPGEAPESSPQGRPAEPDSHDGVDE